MISDPRSLSEARSRGNTTFTAHTAQTERSHNLGVQFSVSDPAAASSNASNFGKRSTGLGATIRKSFTSRGRMSKRFSTRDESQFASRPSRQSVTRSWGGNKNMPSEYSWLSELLEMIVKNETFGVGSLDRSNTHAQSTSPLFVVCGACPSSFAPMQAILYSAVGKGTESIDFWWIKPVKGHPELFEQMTLSRWAKGPHKNDPGRSKPIYKPLGDLFIGNGNTKVQQDYRFGIEYSAPSQECSTPLQRAFIEDPRGSPPARYYLYFVWQEEWTSNPLASNKFIKGKIAYQREPHRGLEAVIFLREYCILNGRMELAEADEPTPPGTILPNTALKELGALKASK